MEESLRSHAMREIAESTQFMAPLFEVIVGDTTAAINRRNQVIEIAMRLRRAMSMALVFIALEKPKRNEDHGTNHVICDIAGHISFLINQIGKHLDAVKDAAIETFDRETQGRMAAIRACRCGSSSGNNGNHRRDSDAVAARELPPPLPAIVDDGVGCQRCANAATAEMNPIYLRTEDVDVVRMTYADNIQMLAFTLVGNAFEFRKVLASEKDVCVAAFSRAFHAGLAATMEQHQQRRDDGGGSRP